MYVISYVYIVIIRTLSARSISAPAPTRNSHTGRWPLLEAHDKGVLLYYINIRIYKSIDMINRHKNRYKIVMSV